MRLYFRIAVPLLTWLAIGAISQTTTADDIIAAAAVYAFASMFAYELLGVVDTYFSKRESELFSLHRSDKSRVLDWIADHHLGLFAVCYFLIPAAVISSMWAFGLYFHVMDNSQPGILAALAKLFAGCFFFSVLDFLSTCFTADYGDPHSPWSKSI